MRTRLGVAVAAILLGAQLGNPLAASQPSMEELTAISHYIEQGDLEALIMYLLQNPHLMEGDTAIAARLRAFLAAAENMADLLAFEPRMRSVFDRDLDDVQVAEFPTEEGSSLY